MTSKRKKFLMTTFALASVLILGGGIGLAQANVQNKIIWQQSDDLTTTPVIWDLWVNAADCSNSTAKTTTPDTDEIEPSASYDGAYVVYAKRNDLPATSFSNGYDVWIRQNDTGDTIVIADGRQPAIGPCNNKVAFVRTVGTSNHIMVASIAIDAQGNVTATNLVQITAGAARNAQWPHISPCGDYVVFASDRDTDWEIYEQKIDIVTNAAVGAATQLTTNAGGQCAHDADMDPVYSPDGTKIAFVSDRDCNNNIYIMNRDGTEQRAVTNDPAFDDHPFFSPDGTEIVFVSYRDPNDNYGDIYKIAALPNAAGEPATECVVNNQNRLNDYPTWGGTTKPACAVCDTPAKPSSLSAVCNDTASVILNWMDNSDGQNNAEDGFRIYFWSDANTGSATVPAKAGTGMYGPIVFAGLNKDTQYCFQVSAYNALGEDTSPVTACAWTCDTPPNEPSGLMMTDCSSAVGVRLAWTNNADNADSFEIERRLCNAAGVCGDWAQVVVLPNDGSNAYNDCCLDSCDTYEYRVRALIHPNATCCTDNASSWSNTLAVHLGDTPTLWVQGPSQNGPSQCCGGVDAIYSNNAFQVKVMASCVTDLHSIKFDIAFDTDIVNTSPVLTLGSQFAGAIMQTNEIDTGPFGRAVKVVITLPHLNDLDCKSCLSGSCEVLSAIFKTVGELGADSDTKIDLFDAEYTKITPTSVCCDTPTQMKECGDTMDAIPGAGPLCCSNLLCDADCDKDADLSDVTKMRRILAGADMANCIDNMDCNEDSDRNGEDVICLMRKLILLPCPPPYAPTREIVAGMGREVAFTVDEVADLDAALLEVRYSKGIQIIGVTAGNLTEGAILFYNDDEKGLLRMILNIPELRGATGSGSIFKVNFVGEGEFFVDKVSLTNTKADFISAEVSQLITVGEELRIIPARTKLYQNFPNPLNPETVIPFDLSAAAQVTINIYSLSGQLIRTLDLGKLEAGSYVDRDKAAIWDGRDNAGVEVSSGVYLYQIKAGDFTSTRKMIVLK